MSEIAGALAVTVGASLLLNEFGGKGILLGGAPGVAPANLMILGAGVLGRSAARTALGMGAQVTLLDVSVSHLRQALAYLRVPVTTYVATRPNLEKVLGYADLVLGAVAVHGERAPVLVTRPMLKLMKPRSVIMDLSIDMGGCFETSRPTSFPSPTYEVEGIQHFCVPNLPSIAARTSTHALTSALLPYAAGIADLGLEQALAAMPDLRRGLYLERGGVRKDWIRETLGLGSDMMDWAQTYRSRITTAEEAVKCIRSGDRVWIHAGCNNPEELVRAMVGRADELRDVEVTHLLTFGYAEHTSPRYAASFRHRALFTGGNVRSAVNEGRADYVPVFLSEIPRLIERGIQKVDVALIHVSPPDEHGFCSYGVGVECTKAAAERAPRVLALVNRQMPRGPGGLLHPRVAPDPRGGDRPPSRGAAERRSPGGGGAGHRAPRGRLSSPTGRPCRWASARSPMRSCSPSRAARTWGCTPRCSRTASSPSSSAG